VARSTSPTGPFTRYGSNPILKRNSTWVSPGHGSFLRDAQGNDWHYYHAYHANNFSKGRVQLLDKITYNSSSWPVFGNGGTPSTTSQTAPVFSPDAAPTAWVAVPSNNATISGTAVLSAGATDDSEVKEVAFYRWGAYASKIRIGTARPTIYGYIVNWDTRTLANGPYDIFAKSTDSYGHFTYSATIRVNIAN
jgi:beta-xylosidase